MKTFAEHFGVKSTLTNLVPAEKDAPFPATPPEQTAAAFAESDVTAATARTEPITTLFMLIFFMRISN